MDAKVIFLAVCTLFCFMIPGFVLRKLNLVGDSFTKSASVLTINITQCAMFLLSYVREFKLEVIQGIITIMVISLIVHLLFYFLAKQMFKKTPDSVRRVLQFALIFSNAGYMGIPVVESVFGAEYTIYVTVYVVWFNIFAFSLGRLIYTDDKQYMSIKEAIVNPAVLSILAGLVIYLTGAGGWIANTVGTDTLLGNGVTVVYDVLSALKAMVAPVTMMIVGVRLADVNFKETFKDKTFYGFLALKMLAFPILTWLLLKPFNFFGIVDNTILAITLVVASTPSAAITSMFAELYGGDKVYAGKAVAVTTLLSTITMPIVALLLLI
ncbi:MAG: AEC family transporter [Clostridia bacterium]|nr:AEC family transporter [Clostridia bacterium]